MAVQTTVNLILFACRFNISSFNYFATIPAKDFDIFCCITMLKDHIVESTIRFVISDTGL